MSLQQKYELFSEYMNNIYCDGYAEQLATTDIEAFDFEFDNFCKTYNL